MKISNLIKTVIFTTAMVLTTQAYALTPNDLTSVFTDYAITANIRTKIMMDHSLTNSKLDVSTNNGLVTLAGNLTSEADASSLVQMTTETAGVREIDTSRLSVANDNQLSDQIITAKVKGLFVRYKLFGEKAPIVTPINVETYKSIVYLTGTAESKKQLDFAIEIASTLRGVDKVKSQVQVKPLT